MSDDSPVRTLVAPMAERPVVLDEEPFRVDRARVLAKMAAAGRPSPRWRAYIPLTAAAAVALALPAWWSLARRDRTEVAVLSGSAVRVESATGEATTLQTAGAFSSPGALETGEGSRAALRTEDGLAIELAADTRVSLGALRTQEGRLDLRRGSVRCTVAHRPASRPFEVVTPEVTVVDLGTIFSVSVDPATQAATVSVEEGEVLLKHRDGETRLEAPGTWSSALQVVAVAAPAASAPPSAQADLAPSPPSLEKQEPKVRRPTSPAGTLRDESRLLRLGLAAERQGHTTEAIARFEELLAHYPQSPLAPDARNALGRVKKGAP
jgi:hypothetical protein